MSRIFNICRYLYCLLWTKISPNAFARHLGVKLGKNVRFYGMKPSMFSTEPWLITIGDDCFFTAGCSFITHDGGTLILRKEVPDLELTAPITIGHDVYVGVNSTILLGTKIGNRCIIGAGSIVKGTFPDNSVIAGIPARVIKSVDEYLESAKKRSLHLGHLRGEAKAVELRKMFLDGDGVSAPVKAEYK